MATPLGERLLMATGVTVPLRPGPVKVTKKLIAKAQGADVTIRRRLRKFVREPKLTKAPDLPEFDYDEIMTLLPQASQESRAVENVAGFDAQDLAMEYADALGSALGYIQRIAPFEQFPALVGTHRLTPSGMDLSEFRRRYAVCDDPMGVLDDMAAGPISPDQVETLKEVYPALYGIMRSTVLEEMVSAGTDDEKFQLPYEKELALQVFLEMDLMDPGIHDQLNQAFDKAREKESGQTKTGAPAPPSRKGIGDPSTMQERLESK